jgi:NADH-quinone oxidoreductase subunit N
VLALTSLAGLPPGIFGLVGKIAALRPVVAEGWVWLAAVAAANAVLGVAVYLRWIRPVMTEPGAPGVAVETAGGQAAPARGTRRAVMVFGLALSAAVLVAVCVQPDLILQLLG